MLSPVAFNRPGKLMVGDGILNAVQVEIALGHGGQIEGPIHGHERVNKELGADRPFGGVVIPKAALHRRDDAAVDDAARETWAVAWS